MNMKRVRGKRRRATQLRLAARTYCAVYEEGAEDNHAQQNRAGRPHHL